MKPNEFADWVRYAGSLFYSLELLFAEPGRGPSRVEAWARVLEPVDAALAREYLEGVLAGAIPRPEPWSLLPAELIRWSGADRQRWSDAAQAAAGLRAARRAERRATAAASRARHAEWMRLPAGDRERLLDRAIPRWRLLKIGRDSMLASTVLVGEGCRHA